MFQRGEQSEPLAGIAGLGHARLPDGYEKDDDDDADVEIGLHKNAEVVLLDGLEACGVGDKEGGPSLVVGGIEARRDVGEREIGSRDGPDGIERLGQIESARGRLVRPHAIDIWVTTGLKERQSAVITK
jgi:hypothetical protein